MRLAVSKKSLSTLLTRIFLVGLTLTAAAPDSVAQAPSGPSLGPAARLRLLAQRGHNSQPNQSSQAPTSGPTWTVVFPGFNDPDVNTNLYGHSAVYDSGSNTMIVFGGLN